MVVDTSATHGYRGVPAAASTWQEGVAASGFLLKEAGGGAAEIFRLQLQHNTGELELAGYLQSTWQTDVDVGNVA